MYEKLEKALKETDHFVEPSRRTDASDGTIIEQTIQRIQDLQAIKAERDQRLALLEKLEEKERLLNENIELKKKIADSKNQAAALQEILRDSMKRPYRKALCYDGLHSEVDELKEKRMHIYEDSRNA